LVLLDEFRSAWQSETRDHRIALTIVLAIAVALRGLYLTQPMRYDEAVTYMYFVRLPWAEALSTYTYPNNHLFHTLLAKSSVAMLGISPWALRIPAFLAGIAVVPAAYVTVRALYGARAALIAAGLVASSGVLVLYSTNARGYSLVVLAFLLLVLLAIRLHEKSENADWLVFAVVAALGLWTVPVMLYPLGCVAAWYALNSLLDDRHGDLKRLGIALAVAGLLTVLLYWPVFSRSGVAAVTRNRFVAPSPWFDFFSELPGTIAEALRSWGLGLPPALALVLLAAALFALAIHHRVSALRIGFPLTAFVWSAWLLVVNHRAPFPRTWLWLVPIAAGLAAAGILATLEKLGDRGRRIAHQGAPLLAVILAVACSFSVVTSFAVLLTRDTGSYREAEEATAVLRGFLRPRDRIIAAIPTNGPLEYYLDRAGIDRAQLYFNERQAERAVGIVDYGEGQSLEALMGQSFVRDTMVWGQPVVVARLAASLIVVFPRKNAPAP
jgi:4-amino-4-deoxy-L-arabinose transferase-like glycosyltransferase